MFYSQSHGILNGKNRELNPRSEVMRSSGRRQGSMCSGAYRRIVLNDEFGDSKTIQIYQI